MDEGFGENTPVDVVIRPEDLYIFPVSEMAQLTGVVQTSIFKGVHYEMTVLCGGYEFLVQDYHHFEVGFVAQQAGLFLRRLEADADAVAFGFIVKQRYNVMNA